ncbi:hypothetical protein [Alkalihalobacterium chitinilyticum]|uniref:Uncharacterized protein n=1 Tax=Alkalihalobacterium chitinilyticum TaxID=2980103 RepID=A0ABT5V9G8_9BACI|nr:hypothetical protein [Alkalihalobacterium chitinilyticum]MDE5412101.1 hypothetical protein [Alkalihalobacterium chitinilyticum]
MGFVVLNKPGVSIECLYYGTGTPHLITGMTYVEQGSTIDWENAKFIVNKGWFIFVTLNGREEYVLYRTIRQLIDEQKMMVKFDIELDKFIISYQIDCGLKEKNKNLFFSSQKKQNAYNIILLKLPPIVRRFFYTVIMQVIRRICNG